MDGVASESAGQERRPTEAAVAGPGTIIGDRYELLRRLGSGGYATVFEAVDHAAADDGARVAVKLLDLRVDAEVRQNFEQRFAREADAIARLEHRNIVRLLDAGFAGELQVPYIVMELLTGCELEHELLTRGALEPRRALALFRGALNGLAEAHARGIVHRDLKPLNLFLAGCPDTGCERLVILDFGIAHAGDSAMRLTSTGELMGTPQYLAPEWIRRQEVSTALDVYQMGLILIEMLCGQPVIQAESAYDCMVAHCQQDFCIPLALLESPLGPILARALALDPRQRFADAAAFANALATLDAASLPRLDAVTVSSRTAVPHESVSIVFAQTEAERASALTRSGDSPRKTLPTPFPIAWPPGESFATRSNADRETRPTLLFESDGATPLAAAPLLRRATSGTFALALLALLGLGAFLGLRGFDPGIDAAAATTGAAAGAASPSATPQPHDPVPALQAASAASAASGATDPGAAVVSTHAALPSLRVAAAQASALGALLTPAAAAPTQPTLVKSAPRSHKPAATPSTSTRSRSTSRPLLAP